jgi:tRNA-2-methylthio-N6-dimethylallyladenosine synthase
MKKIFVKTYGCQMNEYDSKRMQDLMQINNYTATDTPQDADLVVLNTCHIREKAAEKVYSELGRLKKLKDKNQDMKIVVAGCVAQAEGKAMLKRAKVIDIVCGPQTYHRLPEFLKTHEDTGRQVLDTDFPLEEKFDFLPKQNANKKVTAFLSVQEGCDKFCTFCVVPYTRGAEFSRNVEDIITEAKQLCDQGVKELTLLGQNVNAYHGNYKDGKVWSLARLIEEISKINGIERIRYTTSHPNDMSDDLFEAHAHIKKLMPYLHLPVQSGSNKILKAMNRKHTAESYMEIIAKMRTIRPDIALSGDFIVGFPGEEEQDFQFTLNLVKQINYTSSYSFKYSIRPGTPAGEMENQVDENVKTERLYILQALLSEQQKAFNSSLIGKNIEVLVEKLGKHEGQMVGRSPYLQPVHFISQKSQIGDIIKLRVNKSTSNSLEAEEIKETGFINNHLNNQVLEIQT